MNTPTHPAPRLENNLGNGTIKEIEIELLLQSAASTAELNLNQIALQPDTCLYIVDCIHSSEHFHFQKMTIDQSSISLQGFEALINCASDFRKLEHFSCSGCSLPKEAGYTISKLLGARGMLKTLNLSSNRLSDVGVASISGAFSTDLSELDKKAFVSLVTLTELNLGNNSIGDMGILALCRGLTQFAKFSALSGRRCGLRTLLIDDNNITDRGAMCLAQLLHSCFSRAMTRHSLGQDGAVGLIAIDRLSLNNNPISNSGAAALLGFTAAEASISPTNLGLKHLGIGRCQFITSDVFDSVVKAVSAGFLESIDTELSDQATADICRNPNGNFWTPTFRKLSEAIVGSSKPKLFVNLGNLPNTLLNHCERNCKGGYDSSLKPRLYDFMGALDALCVVADTLQLSDEFVGRVQSLWGSMSKSNREGDTNSAVLAGVEKQQLENSKLREQHANAFQTLATEIQKLVADESALPSARLFSPPQHHHRTTTPQYVSTENARSETESLIARLVEKAVSARFDAEKGVRERSQSQMASNEVLESLEQMKSALDTLNARIHNLEARVSTIDPHLKLAQLEQRVVKLEAALLAASFKDSAIKDRQVAPLQASNISEAELRNRLAVLELAVEQEHESSLQVLDALLLQQRQFKSLQSLNQGFHQIQGEPEEKGPMNARRASTSMVANSLENTNQKRKSIRSSVTNIKVK